MEINRTITVNKPLKEVWRKLSGDFGSVHNWNSRVQNSQLEGSGNLLGLNFSSRILETSSGEIREVMTTHDSNTNSLSYRCKEGLPLTLTKVSTYWSMANIKDGTEVLLQVKIQASFVGKICYPFVYYNQLKEASRIVEEFKSYAQR